uniref:Uncharacterized protein n=1 Tax=Solanum tuberosum TaxID=4113 RepID=M1AE24_SOLTU
MEKVLSRRSVTSSWAANRGGTSRGVTAFTKKDLNTNGSHGNWAEVLANLYSGVYYYLFLKVCLCQENMTSISFGKKSNPKFPPSTVNKREYI